MSTTAKLAGLLRDEQGPVAFNDAVDEDAVPVEPLTEHDDAISTMSAAHCNNMQFRCYRGFWISEMWAPGVVAVHRSFAPRADDVLVASLQKSGTTWLKALTFATMARGAWRVAAVQPRPPAPPPQPASVCAFSGGPVHPRARRSAGHAAVAEALVHPHAALAVASFDLQDRLYLQVY